MKISNLRNNPIQAFCHFSCTLLFQNFRTWNKQISALAHVCNIPLAIPFSELNTSTPLPDKRVFPAELQSIGDHLKLYRLSNNSSQKGLIQYFEVDRETIRSWENGSYLPSVKYYPKIIQLLGYYPFEHEQESLGGQIKRYRFINGLSQEQFAGNLQINSVSMGK